VYLPRHERLAVADGLQTVGPPVKTHTRSRVPAFISRTEVLGIGGLRLKAVRMDGELKYLPKPGTCVDPFLWEDCGEREGPWRLEMARSDHG
jgi:hypothetical protein